MIKKYNNNSFGQMAVSKNGTYVYVHNPNNKTVSQIDPFNNKIKTPIYEITPNKIYSR